MQETLFRRAGASEGLIVKLKLSGILHRFNLTFFVILFQEGTSFNGTSGEDACSGKITAIGHVNMSEQCLCFYHVFMYM